MTGLSSIIITRNEEANIAACIGSVAFADEIVVVDSGSTDRTVELARAAGAKVIVSSGWPGFGPQKNLALSHATQPWVLSIDADERVTPGLREPPGSRAPHRSHGTSSARATTGSFAYPCSPSHAS